MQSRQLAAPWQHPSISLASRHLTISMLLITALITSSFTNLASAASLTVANNCSRSQLHELLNHMFTMPPSSLSHVNCMSDQNNHIVLLDLSGLVFNGSSSLININMSLAATTFQNLAHLNLSSNSLIGSIPPYLWNLGTLKQLDLSSNRFNGTIFLSHWSNFTQLTYLNISFNDLQFDPLENLSSINDLKLPALETLDLSHNPLMAGMNPSIQDRLCSQVFPNLVILNFGFNSFSSASFLSSCGKLQVLHAASNRLSGSELLPNLFLYGSAALSVIDLHNNSLNGEVPSLQNLATLQILNLSFNNLSGEFGEAQGKILMSLNFSLVDISHNNLTIDIGEDVTRKYGPRFVFAHNQAISSEHCSVCASPAPSPSFVIGQTAATGRNPMEPSAIEPRSKVKKAIIAGIIIGGTGGLVMIALSIIMCKRRRAKKEMRKWRPAHPTVPGLHHPDKRMAAEMMAGPFSFEADARTWVADVKDPTAVDVVVFEKPLLKLTFADLLQATRSFDRETEDVEGGDGGTAGLVYTCVLPAVDPARVAIQVARMTWRDDGAAAAALEAMGKIRHPNVVPLLGYCIVGQEKLLIYRYVEGRTLHEALHGTPGGELLHADAESGADMWEGDEDDIGSRGSSLGWAGRVRAGLGAARALAYLHDGCCPPVVHGVLTSNCILLDGEDGLVGHYGGAFGLARQMAQGYVAPECGSGAVGPTAKSDVYSMGVVMMELATGRRALGNYGPGCTTLAGWVRAVLAKEKGQAHKAVDGRLLLGGLPSQASPVLPHVLEMLRMAYLCTADNPSKRPSMPQVVALLKDLSSSSAAAAAAASLPPS